MDLLDDFFRDALHGRGEGCDGSVLMVGNLIQGRGVNPGNLRRFNQKLPASPAVFFIFLIQIQQLPVDGLALSDVKKIEKVRDGFRIVGAGAAADHDRVVFSPVR